MDHWISPAERAAFKRCRRQWDLGSPNRANLEPAVAQDDLLAQAIHDALAVYYYPGMWDWPSPIVLPLVQKAFLRTLGEQAARTPAEQSPTARFGGAILQHYIEVAPSIDDFSPVKIDHEVEGILPDPRDAERGLVDSTGQRVIYTCQVDMLAVDADDAYWVLRHQLVPRYQNIEALLLDEYMIAQCWAWEQSYIGMEIEGTIHNELLSTGLPDPSEQRPNWTDLPERGGLAQHEPSGGGRSIPQHRRQYGRPGMTRSDRVSQRDVGGVRRTKISRTRQEIEQIGAQLGIEALEMTGPAVPVYPTPAEHHCATCQFLSPCLAMTERGEAEELLSAGFRTRSAEPARGKLGGRQTGMGRGGLSFGNE